MALAGNFELLRPTSTARTTCTGCLPRGSALGGLSLPFLDAGERRFLERGAGLEPDGRAGRHRPVSPVRGFSAVRFGVSRTTKAPKSGRVKRPVPMISPLMASMMSAASLLAATAGIAVDRTMASVRNFLDTQVSFRACEGGERPALSAGRKARGRPEHRILARFAPRRRARAPLRPPAGVDQRAVGLPDGRRGHARRLDPMLSCFARKLTETQNSNRDCRGSCTVPRARRGRVAWPVAAGGAPSPAAGDGAAGPSASSSSGRARCFSRSVQARRLAA